MDWVFDGDNTKQLVRLLAKHADSTLLTQKSFRVFIEVLWSYYQKYIFIGVFIPQIIFTGIFIFLCTYTAGYDFNYISSDDSETPDKYKFHETEADVLSAIAIVLQVFFISIEIRQLCRDGFIMYTSNKWNQVDAVSNSLNIAFLVLMLLNLHGKDVITNESLRVIGALAAFLHWLKIFYFMRLFKPTASFLTLILQTLTDIGTFLIMLFIIICGFANFFFIININATNDPSVKTKKDEYSYVEGHTKNDLINAIMEMYFLGLGEFASFGNYAKGDDSGIAWTFFIFATFILLVVFMNMLIAIMGDTFGSVQSMQTENQMFEQCQMMYDYLWVADIKTRFKGKKFIFIVTPSKKVD